MMALLFVLGVMNSIWIALLAVSILLERTAPWPRTIRYAGGEAMIGAGLAVAYV
jgi:predicted metal-binding membrane protein